jgi:hypothetical protein
MKMPSWLNKEVEEVEEMIMDLPPVARLQEPRAPQPTPERELITRALAVANEQEQQQKDLMVKLTEATLRNESYRRQIQDQSATISALQSNELNFHMQIELLRQENSELKAFFQQHRSAMEWILKRFDEYSIPKGRQNDKKVTPTVNPPLNHSPSVGVPTPPNGQQELLDLPTNRR